MFDKLDAQAVKAVLAAQEESRRQGHKFVDIEQLLLGLMADAQGLPARVFETLGLKHQIVRKRINETLGRGNDFVGIETPFTARLKHLLESAWQAASQSGRTSISTKDLLLAFSKDLDGTAAEILAEAGITAEKLSLEVEKAQ